MLKLELYKDYTRKDVHDIFSADTFFYPQTGTWGLQGIVSIPGRPRDYVFLVTFGKQQGDHIFDESITVDGVLSWQSQPHQTLANKNIENFIIHNELTNTIYLFLRTNLNRPYTYLGKLKYLSHDTEREKPVYFQWQILDWEPGDTPRRIGLVLQPLHIEEEPVIENGAKNHILTMVDPPGKIIRDGVSTPIFRTKKNPDYAAKDARNRKVGLAGELLVLEYEIISLLESGRGDLAKKVRHVSQIEGDHVGYDINSYTPDGTPKYIEVKTSVGQKTTDFYLSTNEFEFSRTHIENYYLYRLFNFDEDTLNSKFFIIKGSLHKFFTFTPTEYKASLVEGK